MRGRLAPEDISHSSMTLPNTTGLTRRADEMAAFCACAQPACPAAMAAKSRVVGAAATAVMGAAGPCIAGDGMDNVSATTLSSPLMCWTSLVNSAIYANCQACLPIQGSYVRCTAYVSGLWSIKMLNCRPSSINRKCLIAAKHAYNSLSNVEYFVWADDRETDCC
jgi:hypothetical protein